MGEECLNSIAVINIERAYVNRTIKNDMVKIIDTFGRRNGRDIAISSKWNLLAS
jgi:hypothetical protein